MTEELSQLIEETGKQIRQLEAITDGVAGDSLRKILQKNFKLTYTSMRTYARKGDESIELDAFGYAKDEQKVAVIVAVRSHLTEDSLEYIEELLEKFPKFFPEHADKKLYSLIACEYAPESLENVLRKKGIYLAIMHDDIFKLKKFKNFTPTDFSKN